MLLVRKRASRRWAGLLLAGIFLSPAALAQAWVYVTPSDGVAIKRIQPRVDGWVMVTFADSGSLPQLGPCFNLPMGSVTHENTTWLNPSRPGFKSLYATVLSASLVGKKLTQITITYVDGACELVNVTTQQ